MQTVEARLLGLNPEILIPANLGVTTNLKALKRHVLMGGWNDDELYEPPLSIYIVEKDTAREPLISLIAHEPVKDVLEVLEYYEAESLRNSEVGRSFFDHISEVFKNLGYKYIFGEGNITLGFLFKMAEATVADIPKSFEGCDLLNAYCQKYYGSRFEAIPVKPL